MSKILDELKEDGFINHVSYHFKSVQIYDKGVEQAKILLEKYNIKDWDE